MLYTYLDLKQQQIKVIIENTVIFKYFKKSIYSKTEN